MKTIDLQKISQFQADVLMGRASTGLPPEAEKEMFDAMRKVFLAEKSTYLTIQQFLTLFKDRQ